MTGKEVSKRTNTTSGSKMTKDTSSSGTIVSTTGSTGKLTIFFVVYFNFTLFKLIIPNGIGVNVVNSVKFCQEYTNISLNATTVLMS